MKHIEMSLDEFAGHYANAWCSGDPNQVAAFFSENGTLKVNDGDAAVGRPAIAKTAKAFMTAFPDMTVTFDKYISQSATKGDFHWTLSGTNTGPGGSGKRVQISGYEEWTFGKDGLVETSLGHFDDGEYQRQLRGQA